jgi:TDG/mug DNA glycosylase family protein
MSEQQQKLIGNQTVIDWMGTPTLTLADIWPDRPWAMIVGLNPAPDSVTAGHYYQGKVGQRQVRRLVDAGLFTVSSDELFFEEAAVRAGVGFSDLVKRPTAREGGVSAAERAHGRALLESELAARNVGLVICVFRHPVEALLGSSVAAGYQARRTSWGAPVFRLPGPFEERERARAVMDSLEMTAW